MLLSCNVTKGLTMAFCKFSTEHNIANNIVLDNVFLSDYLPFAPDCCTKVYLYGLLKCQDCNNANNTLDCFAQDLNMQQEDVKSAFLYWQDQGLVTVLNLSPIEVRYLPIRAKKYSEKMFKTEKYNSFNRNLQEVIDGRMITPHEYREFYLTMESLHIDESAMLMIAKYCTNAKGNNVGYNYILTVAKNWAYEGVHSASDVEQKISEMEMVTSNVKDILVALKSKRLPSFEDRENFNKWTKQLGFDCQTILQVAKTIKRGGMEKLDKTLESYYQNKLFSLNEIKNFEKEKDDLYELAKQTSRTLGVYYENLQPVISDYILKWRQMGYQSDAILLVAKICFKKFVRTFEAMDSVISKYYAKGLVSMDAINEYIAETLDIDKNIKLILEQLELSRQVTSWDRDFYNTWTNVWKFSNEMIDYAVSLAVGKSQPMQYINKVLSNWKELNINTVQQAKQTNLTSSSRVSEPKQEFMTHSFSSEELNALFDNLDEVKLI